MSLDSFNPDSPHEGVTTHVTGTSKSDVNGVAHAETIVGDGLLSPNKYCISSSIPFTAFLGNRNSRLLAYKTNTKPQEEFTRLEGGHEYATESNNRIPYSKVKA
ncbi:MAG: hypothetical protein Q9M91_07530 [Candidatus Dojkabacteria bacterium]|nr:hypothetical protein [Candidatus Dojkabacteria bacterium]MDQ7021637.1 hypothetical protein [Candidatus Dojkabacteria bacterium]